MRKLTDVEQFMLNPGDTVLFEHSVDLDYQKAIPVSSFTLMASEPCMVVYTPISDERVNAMRSHSMTYYREGLERLMDKHDGTLTRKQIDNFFEKEIFYNKLRHETE